MTEKLTMKKLSGELDELRARVKELELSLERKLESTLESAAEKLRTRIESHETPEHGRSIGAVQRQQMIAEEAYLIAERRDFEGGDPARDWAEAERLVNIRLMQADAPAKPATQRRKKPAPKRPASKAGRPKT